MRLKWRERGGRGAFVREGRQMMLAAASAKSAMRPDIRGREMWPLAKMDVAPTRPPACRAADYRTEVRGGGFWRLNTWDSNLDFQVTYYDHVSVLGTPG